MIKTIALGSCVYVQGPVVRTLPNGHLVVRVGEQVFTGPSVTAY